MDFEPISHSNIALVDSVDSDQLDSLVRPYLSLGSQLAGVLRQKNGFYSYGGAFLMRPCGVINKPYDIERWNEPTTWKSEYHLDLEETLFFAEDVFGLQFCIHKLKICSFDPETGEFEPLVDSFIDFSKQIKDDSEYLTGSSLLKNWEKVNGALPVGCRLIAKQPFVCGGEFANENFAVISDVRGMINHATLARQIRDVPDGATIRFNIED